MLYTGTLTSPTGPKSQNFVPWLKILTVVSPGINLAKCPREQIQFLLLVENFPESLSFATGGLGEIRVRPFERLRFQDKAMF